MKLSGFTFVKNATKLYYPVKQSIASVLDIVDEFVVALGDNDENDHTRDEIDSLKSPKIKIIHTVWDLEKFPRGMEHAHQTDIAKNACSGDWLIYLQSDEVLHEKYLATVADACKRYLQVDEVEGILLEYKHFWGDYWHYHRSHVWYPREIRIVRNLPDIHSWESAQSFRRIPDFDGINYRVHRGTYKLKVALIDACIYHYGWVRPPDFMQKKRKAFSAIHRGRKRAEQEYEHEQQYFDYGPLDRLQLFRETAPKVMEDWIAGFDWADKLQYSGSIDPNRTKYKHENLKYRLLTFIEQNFLNGRMIGGFKNYRIIRP
jgi:hypothetical protein